MLIVISMSLMYNRSRNSVGPRTEPWEALDVTVELNKKSEYHQPPLVVCGCWGTIQATQVRTKIATYSIKVLYLYVLICCRQPCYKFLKVLKWSYHCEPHLSSIVANTVLRPTACISFNPAGFDISFSLFNCLHKWMA